jgi:hypothetical protein
MPTMEVLETTKASGRFQYQWGFSDTPAEMQYHCNVTDTAIPID